jgi:putative DNA primase/helicase
VGPGGTGKSTLICLLQHLIGVDNSVPTDLKNLEQNRFEAAGLYRKKLAVISDSSKYGGTLDKLKAITGGDPIRLERKYRQQGGLFTFTGVVVIAGNEVIQSVDYTSGLSRRRLTVVMNNRVEEAKRDPDLLDKLCSELPGILNWVLALDWKSAREILRNTASIGLERSREVQLDTNPIAAWADECLVYEAEAKAQIGNLPNDPDMFEAKISKWLYVSYVHWCRSGGYRPMAIRRFSSLLCDLGENLGYDVAKHRDGKGNKIRGLRLREASDVGKPSFVTNFVPTELGI